MAKIVYVGGNVVDWNTEIARSYLDRVTESKKDREGNEIFKLTRKQIFQLDDKDDKNFSVFLYLKKGKPTRFRKNPENKDAWEIKQALNQGEKATAVFSCLRRPGGGAANNMHNAATLAGSIKSSNSLELLVLDESPFVRDIFRNELVGANFSYDYVRQFKGQELSNAHFRCDGRMISYTSLERKVSDAEEKDLETKLKERFNFQEGDFLVVNSVKDRKYLSGILKCYDAAKAKPVLVAAVTNSMLNARKKEEGLDVPGLIERADIYVSNIEEFYELLKKQVFSHISTWREIDDDDLYNGMLHILKNCGKEKRRVYVTCGDNGAVVMDSDSNLYFQRVSGITETPTQKSPIVDLNGAGDTFAGVLTLLEAEGRYSVQEILDYSNAASQICIRRNGANGKNRITARAIRKFRQYHSQGIWKYNPAKQGRNRFQWYGSVKCNLI